MPRIAAVAATAALLAAAPLAAAAPAVTRDVVASGPAAGAPGRTIELYRVTAAPGAVLAPHYHPGTQVAEVLSGRLAYTVLRGRAFMRRHAASGARRTEVVPAGRTVVLGAGDGLLEPAGMRHTARVPGPAPVVIVATVLRRSDAPVAITLPAG